MNEPGHKRIIEPCVDYLQLNQTMILVARDQTDQKLYRARLIAWDYDQYSKIFKGTVCFIDTGRTQKCQLEDLFMFTQEIRQSKLPPRCFQCRLAEIQPSTANISGGHMWDRDGVERFKSLVNNIKVKAEVNWLIRLAHSALHLIHFITKFNQFSCRFIRLSTERRMCSFFCHVQ